MQKVSLADLIEAACTAEEMFELDELEEYADAEAERRRYKRLSDESG